MESKMKQKNSNYDRRDMYEILQCVDWDIDFAVKILQFKENAHQHQVHELEKQLQRVKLLRQDPSSRAFASEALI